MWAPTCHCQHQTSYDALIRSMPHHTDAIICAKRALTKFWVHKWTYFSEGQHFSILKCQISWAAMIINLKKENGLKYFNYSIELFNYLFQLSISRIYESHLLFHEIIFVLFAPVYVLVYVHFWSQLYSIDCRWCPLKSINAQMCRQIYCNRLGGYVLCRSICDAVANQR